ncbi:MAG: HAD family hydrolase [Oscillospiraceae bacterium]|nr:HAD family hydrolase [Oscillospiraceae bacterium]
MKKNLGDAMLKFKCLVLDHDDTVVQSEKTIGYPCFCQTLSRLRPEAVLTFEDYVMGCHNLGFVAMCREKWQFTDEELKVEYQDWMEFIRVNQPVPFPGIERIIRRQKKEGGLICVVSHSNSVNIRRDYETNFHILPDRIYGCELPKEQQKPAAYPLEDIMRRYELSAEQLIVVDDMKLAWKMSKPLGVPFAFAAWSKAEFPQLTEDMRSISDFTFDSVAELEKFLFE